MIVDNVNDKDVKKRGDVVADAISGKDDTELTDLAQSVNETITGDVEEILDSQMALEPKDTTDKTSEEMNMNDGTELTAPPDPKCYK